MADKVEVEISGIDLFSPLMVGRAWYDPWYDSLPRFDPEWDDVKPRLVYRNWREWHWFRIYALLWWLLAVGFIIYCSVSGWPS